MEGRRQWLQGRFCQRHGVVPLVDDGTTVTLGISGRLCPKVQEQLEHFYYGYKDIRWRQLEDEEFQMHLARHFSISHGQEQERTRQPELPAATMGEQMMATAAPVVNMLNSILHEAIMRDATDIHISPDSGGWRTGLRIDGRVEGHLELEEEMGRLVISRIKLLSGMNVLEHRRCQDGRFTHLQGGREHEVRASILPAWNGEAVVLRILEGWRPIPSLEELGFTGEQRATLERLVGGKEDKAGLVLVTGPTGSGTTTIEYTAGGTTKTIRYADGTAETLRYDMAGAIIEAMGATGTLRYSYDAAGLLSSQTDTATGETVTYAYDRAGRRILMAGAGRETAYRYGRNGELLEVSDNRQRLSVSYKYDVMGRETERTFGNGVSQHTAYDKAGRVILITEKSGNNILLRGEGYVYDSLGRRSATVSHTGAVTRYEYNPAGQLAKVYYPDSQELRDLQEQEARQHGLFWQEGVGGLSNGHLSTGEYTELSRLFVWMRNGGGFLPTTQVFRTEMYTYDANGNRATKTTAYGTITYSYDAENRLQKTCGDTGVGVEYTYDSNGNLLSQASSLKHSIYEYNPQNRMVRSRVIDDEARTIASTRYGYDVLGRRTLVQDNNATTLRTLYDGLGFDVVKESPVYASGGFVDTYNTGIQYTPAGRATGDRYRYLDDGAIATSEKYQYIEDNAYQTVSSRYAGERTMLYAHGSPVAINRSSGTRGYLGTDILGSTRSVTDNHGVQESFYDYDIFGSPITGNYTTGADYGYLGKPYDSITGLYNYGYRDYSPQSVRFTTVDPIRDGSNWFVYVNNDPVNYVDLWGLLASDIKAYKVPIAGGGATLVVGANVELAVVYDTANNIGLAVSIDGGVGVSAEIDLPISTVANVILDRAIDSFTNSESISGTIQDFEGIYSTTSVHVIAGVETDLNNPQDVKPSIDLSIGGGVYWGYTKVIEIIDGDGKK